MNPWIDITVPLRNGMVHWPGDQPFQISRTDAIANGDVCNLSQISLSVHTGTHMDAPLHFVADGESIDHMPLDATMGPARVIAIRNREVICREELQEHRIQRGERVLFKTALSDRDWSMSPFNQHYICPTLDAASYLAECGVRCVGVDYLSIGSFLKDGPETHRRLLSAGIWVIEGLALGGIESGDYELICLPLRLVGSDGSPARAVLRRIV